MKKVLFFFIIMISFARVANAQEKKHQCETYLFAERDTCELYLDFYKCAAPANAPTVVFAFGGGFVMGTRNDEFYDEWFEKLIENGCNVATIDYRLGLKGQKRVNTTSIKPLENAIKLAVEDMVSALVFLDDNAAELGIDSDRIIISGSSAGAITALQTEFELYNRTELVSSLRKDFKLAGVMSFSGAIFSRKGKLKYEERPCPTLLLHGTADKIVPYKQIKFFNIGFYGSDKVVERLRKYGCTTQIFRYKDNTHEIASQMSGAFDKEKAFIEDVVVGGQIKVLDKIVEDPSIKPWGGTLKDIYKNNKKK